MLRLPALLVFLLVPTHRVAQEILRGRVTASSGRPVVGAQILARRATDGGDRAAVTDSLGAWTIDWQDGSGDYLVRVTAPAYESATIRVRRTGTDSVLIADVVLERARAAQHLAPMVVQAPAPRIERTPPHDDVGAREAFGTDPDLLPPSSAGDLGAFGTQMSDVVTTSGGISVLGTGPVQNAVTLNGFAFPGSQIPRDVKMRARITASSYDPSVGWFTGARTNVQLAPGGLFTSRTARATVDARALQSGTPLGTSLGQNPSRFDVSLAGDGPLFGPFTYNAGVQATRTAARQATLTSASPDALRAAGVAPDSVASLMRVLSAAGVPLGGLGDQAVTDHVTLLGRVDHAPYDWSTLQPARTTWGLTAFGDFTRQGAVGRSVGGTASHGGTSTRQIGLLEAEVSSYLRGGALFSARTAASVDRGTTARALGLPDGRVRVASVASGAELGGLTTLAFGGNSGMQSDSRRWTWESGADLQLYPAGYSAHRVRIAGDLRVDGFADAVAPNALGTFSFNSLSDLAANRPSAFSRAFGAPTQRGTELNAFLSVGDLWRASEKLQWLYGVRLERNAFANTPPANPDIARDFGTHTDRAPSGTAVLPRAGFTYSVGNRGGRPIGSIRGGTGAFRNLLDPRIVGGPSVLTGLPSGTSRLACVGAGVPSPDWSAYSRDPSSVPTQCAAGVDGILGDDSPDVRLLDPGFQPQLAWRSNLGWASSWHGFGYSISGVYSDDRHQPGVLDLNFADVPRFSVADEGRPVFVAPSSIVGSTGAVSSVDARRVAAFGQVSAEISNLRAISRQATVSIMPPLVNLPRGAILAETGLSYSLSTRRVQQVGFSSSAFDDPTRVEWARGDLDVRHRIAASTLFAPSHNGFRLLIAAQLQSGMPYTPLVAGDVNGDGLANDRAFIHDTGSSAVSSLLERASPRTRHCLASQLGRAAAPNSCEGPWTGTLNANLLIGHAALHALPERANITVSFTNVLAGIDRLLHGANGVRGWGSTPVSDPVLYAVRGFDPATSRFRYELNPRFGDSPASSALTRTPFRVTIDMHVDIGPAKTPQQLDRWLKPGRTRPGARLHVPELVRRLERNVPDPYSELLAQADSLLLTSEQAASLQLAHTHYRARMDSLWTDVARYLDRLPDRYDESAAWRRTDAAIDDAWEVTRLDVREQFAKILTPAQLALLPAAAGQFWTSPGRIHDRRFIS
ncbi:MAG: carboxypeptidase-like regulatory domain-containing protein [Gemmatimonadaceae bacterium]